MLADNRIALNASWDTKMLSLEIADLWGLGADLSALGFSTKELARALSRVEGGLMGEDEVPEIAEVAITCLGDIWQLGAHRIACGDSRDETLVKALFAGSVGRGLSPSGVVYRFCAIPEKQRSGRN